MTPQILLLFVLLASMVYCFLTEKLPLDLTAFIGLIIISVIGLISPEEAFSGFSSPAVITMISIFFISAALRQTGLADWLALRLHRKVGDGEAANVAAVMLVASFFSAFMNNVAAVALLLPSVMSIAARSRIAPSRLLMPLSFGTLLGGMTTLIGTPPNMIAAEVLRARGLQPFGFLDFTPIGLACVILGTLFMVLIGRHFLPLNEVPRKEQGAADLVRTYKLFEQIFSVRVTKESSLDGQSIANTHLGDLLGAQVIAILRDKKQHLAPHGADILRAGDVLVLGGRVSDLAALRRYCGVSVDNAEGAIGAASADVRGATIELASNTQVPWGALTGHSIGELELYTKYGAVVVGIERDGALLYKEISSTPLRQGDLLHVLGSPEALECLAVSREFKMARRSIAAAELIERHLFMMRVPQTSGLAGISIRESRLGELLGLTVVGIVRGVETLLALDPAEQIQAGDKLLVVGEPRQLEALNAFGEMEILSDTEQAELESSDVGLVEVILSPRSRLVGSSLKDLRFRERYDFQVLSIWREGNPYSSRLGKFVLKLGDALLLQGPRSKMPLLASDADFVVLSGLRFAGMNSHKAPHVIAALLLLILPPAFGLLPAHLSAFMAATLVVFSGAVKMQDAYREVEWRVVFFVATLLPLGIAFDKSGASELIAKFVVFLVDGHNPYPALILIAVLGSLISQLLDSAPAVVLLSPVAIYCAQHLGVSPYPFMMALGLSASVAYMTPFSHKANLLVVGPGGYRASDFFGIGTWLTLLILAVMILIIPLAFPFH